METQSAEILLKTQTSLIHLTPIIAILSTGEK